MKRMMACLAFCLLLAHNALATPFVQEVFAPDGSLEWRGSCFAGELPALLQGVAEDELVSGASLELPARQLALAVMTTLDGRTLAYVQEAGEAWTVMDISGFASGSVGLHDRADGHPVFCLFNPYSSREPSYHLEYLDGAFQLTAYAAQEHLALELETWPE